MYKKSAFFSIIPIFSSLMSMEEYNVNNHHKAWSIVVAACARYRTPLRSVCTGLRDISSKNNLDIYASRLLELNENQKTYALHLAQYKQKIEIIKNLCFHGAKITIPFFVQPSAYDSPFNVIRLPQYLVAAYFGDTNYLLSHCTEDKDLSSTMGICHNTALHLAVKNGHLTAVETLLGHPSINKIINVHNDNHETALLLAAYLGQFWITKLLLEHPLTDLDLYSKDSDTTMTPLYAACCNGHTHIAQLCIEKRPEWKNFCFKGQTPLDGARRNNYTDIVQLLE